MVCWKCSTFQARPARPASHGIAQVAEAQWRVEAALPLLQQIELHQGRDASGALADIPAKALQALVLRCA